IIIYSGRDGSFRVWDFERGMQVGEEWEDSELEESAMAVSPDGKMVTTGGNGGAVKLWNVDTGKVIKKWTGHTSRVRSVCWSPDGGRVVPACLVYVVDYLCAPSSRHGMEVSAIALSPSGKTVATGSWDGPVRLWDVDAGKII
ncbi:WD40-repeat-containing domain protein, partial [Suillus spraguei]